MFAHEGLERKKSYGTTMVCGEEVRKNERKMKMAASMATPTTISMIMLRKLLLSSGILSELKL